MGGQAHVGAAGALADRECRLMWQRTNLVSEAILARLLVNGHATAGGEDIDPAPVVKLFTSDAGATWLLTEIDPDDPDRAFGLCDLGLGCPELGWVRFSELETVRGRLGLPVEVDRYFDAKASLSEYARKARAACRIEA